MIHSRKEREKLESDILAPFATRSGESRGRRQPEAAHDYRSEFQRDRDRVIHSPAFRRLEYKTQVFVNGTADHYRTRLTHTIEMTAIGRTLARALRVNEDLVEAIALAHDIGHSPFGHVGERELDTLMREHGGFDHNEQSLRWVEHLEQQYPLFNGLNLTWEVRAGLRKHQAAQPDEQLDGYPIGPFQSAEAQIADVADDIAYYAHDVEDGLEAGLITVEQLGEVELWRNACAQVDEAHGKVEGPLRTSSAIRALLDLMVQDVLDTSRDRLAAHQPHSFEDIMQCPERIVDFSPAMKEQIKPHRAFLFDHVYWHPDVHDVNQDAVRMMKRLFLHYVEHPEDMGAKARTRLGTDGVWRTACDYVSGMTDRYAIEEYQRFGLNRDVA